MLRRNLDSPDPGVKVRVRVPARHSESFRVSELDMASGARSVSHPVCPSSARPLGRRRDRRDSLNLNFLCVATHSGSKHTLFQNQNQNQNHRSSGGVSVHASWPHDSSGVSSSSSSGGNESSSQPPLVPVGDSSSHSTSSWICDDDPDPDMSSSEMGPAWDVVFDDLQSLVGESQSVLDDNLDDDADSDESFLDDFLQIQEEETTARQPANNQRPQPPSPPPNIITSIPPSFLGQDESIETHLVIKTLSTNHHKVAVVEDGEVVELINTQQHADDKSNSNTGDLAKNDIVLATITSFAAGMDAYLVATTPRGLLPASHLSREKGKKVPTTRLLQVQRASVRNKFTTKGPRLTSRLSLPGRFAVLLPNRKGEIRVSRKLSSSHRQRLMELGDELRPCLEDCGLILRTEAAEQTRSVLERDVTTLATTWDRIRRQADQILAQQEIVKVCKAPPKGRRKASKRAAAKDPETFCTVVHSEASPLKLILRDLFTRRVTSLIVDSPKSYEQVEDMLCDLGIDDATTKDKIMLYDYRRHALNANTEVMEEEHASRALLAAAAKRRGRGRRRGKTGNHYDVFESLLGFETSSISEDNGIRIQLDAKLPGAHIVVQQTEALWAIDVNAGAVAFDRDASDDDTMREQINVHAARVIARTIRLHDVTGLVIVDFINHDTFDYSEVEEEMASILARDRAAVSFLPISPFGVMQITRQRRA